MGTILKLLVVLAIVNAAARAGQAAWHHYQLEDEAQRLVQFAGATALPEDLHAEILAKAQSLSIDLQPADVDVHREDTRTIASARYTIPVELFPGYTRPIPFSFTVEAFAIAGAAPVRRR